MLKRLIAIPFGGQSALPITLLLVAAMVGVGANAGLIAHSQSGATAPFEQIDRADLVSNVADRDRPDSRTYGVTHRMAQRLNSHVPQLLPPRIDRAADSAVRRLIADLVLLFLDVARYAALAFYGLKQFVGKPVASLVAHATIATLTLVAIIIALHRIGGLWRIPTYRRGR